jgi:5-methylcytosine-specific restriction endonuclease McrA
MEMFDSREIFERDGWRCGICRRRVSQKLSWPHPRSVSLDHIVPISAGGGHVRENVQCSHLECNLRKLDLGPGQLLLVG